MSLVKLTLLVLLNIQRVHDYYTKYTCWVTFLRLLFARVTFTSDTRKILVQSINFLCRRQVHLTWTFFEVVLNSCHFHFEISLSPGQSMIATRCIPLILSSLSKWGMLYFKVYYNIYNRNLPILVTRYRPATIREVEKQWGSRREYHPLSTKTTWGLILNLLANPSRGYFVLLQRWAINLK